MKRTAVVDLLTEILQLNNARLELTPFNHCHMFDMNDHVFYLSRLPPFNQPQCLKWPRLTMSVIFLKLPTIFDVIKPDLVPYLSKVGKSEN